MAKATRRRARARAPLSRERVLRAAITLADKGGIASLTMRKLGQALGVEAMSLYRHVASRDEILDGIVAEVIGEIALPAKGADWKVAMRERAISAHDVLVRHPWAPTLIESRVMLRPATMRYADAIIGSLRDGGFPIQAALRAMLILDSYVYGFTLQEVSWPVPAAEVAESTARLRAEVQSDAYPNLAEMVEYVAAPGTQLGRPSGDAGSDYPAEFEFGLDLILDGLQRLRDAG